MENLKEINFIVVHHSGKGNLDSFEKIKNFHIKKNKWEDIGYHWLINSSGKILKGRDEKFVGAHVFGYNKYSLGICLIGNYEKNKPTKKQLNSLLKLLKEKIKQYKIKPENIKAHNEFPGVKKECPGRFIDINKIRKLVLESS
ncbi:N-acetylmuramoyl-L-alanine amidase [Candidatus Pacearchaeota archaeon]|nr:N-acetylmuramoyl-L-alanine amidase [Candidatus Pacearchaeota archaeon]